MSGPRAWVDGAARGNPGEAGFGVVVEIDETRFEIGGYLGRATNNVAEYVGTIAALAWAEQLGLENLILHSDSELVVRQLSGEYRVKAPHLRPFYHRVLDLRDRLPGLEIHHVSRKENRAADDLANRAIDERMELPEWLDIPKPDAS
ncbi:MAG: ribonuclease HI family protein [Thermoanaerobaculia bacterium]|nr:ribonuclease HI family protein [Thermoanaerobaculia bacterium]